ncbi:heparinase II/III family protein [Lutibacter sp.]|uniref:heparinase II/III family protein n=1 Tax=Lutibacter sp. TaxID=1925666 RepID=UPI001A21246A|nr:heparinase II/III family protein [Lutibacter sp.]MBI9042096.1 heparinase II/III family protein [Lutibacter sp.]
MKNIKVICLLVIGVWFQITVAQQLPDSKIIPTNKLSKYLKEEAKKELKGDFSIKNMANFFREKYAERYFYNWKIFDQRFQDYKTLYPESEASHNERAIDHISKFSDVTPWVLPFNYLNGDPVNAYAMRHLARQHKMVDIAFQYHYLNENSNNLTYFKNQLQSLNTALKANKYETIKDGNGVFEAFRSGYRVLNWLQIHSMFLGQENYTDEDQLITVATLLQHASSLYKENVEFVPGNHQTRGMSALAMLSIIFSDFKDADLWRARSMKLLEEHMLKEINDDGFQFERSVHYHMSDIDNYYYVYQLAKISKVEVSTIWEQKLKSLFVTLTKIAYPDKSSPVLQDDTDNPWAEKNDISGAITLGYLLFEDPEMGYFSSEKVDSKMYWYLNEHQLSLLKNIVKKEPTTTSTSFPTTGYFIQRDGWNANDKMLIISAGLDDEKPDHQHGDMLGIQAMAYGKVILPNYQVRYSLADYEFFKNSMVKNVALVDDELQGKNYKGNQGGSGFGKFGELPNPKVITWNTSKELDVFVGAHDGFSNVGVNYTRQVIDIKNGFWIVKDNFYSEKKHTYKQVWQGHYSLENSSSLIRATFDDATGNDIFQLNSVDDVQSSGARGKQWSVVSKNNASNFSFITVVYPYEGFENRIDETSKNKSLKGWKLNDSNWKLVGDNVVSLSKENQLLAFSVRKISLGDFSMEISSVGDFFVTKNENKITIQLIGDKELELNTEGTIECTINGVIASKIIKMAPGIVLECKIK